MFLEKQIFGLLEAISFLKTPMSYLKKILFFYFILCATAAFAQINIRVINKNTDFNDSNTFLRFESDPNNLSGTINNEPVVARQSYSLAEAKEGINLEYNIAGRIFFSLGNPLDPSSPPEPNNPSFSSYHTRFDKIELTYQPDNPYSVANLTIIDFFSIPICLKTYKNGVLVNSLDLSVDGETIAKDLAQLTHNSPKAVIKDDNENFLRVLGPPSDNISDVYPSMKEYIDSLKGIPSSFRIEDSYYHFGETSETQTQKYSFAGMIDYNGDLLLEGSGEKIGVGHKIKILHTDLLQGIYGCNPNYSVDGLPSNIGQNDVYSAVVRDTLTGFNLGFIGSSAVHPNIIPRKTFKDLPSRDWWTSPKAFDYAQPLKPFYNQWSRCIAKYSSSYSFPFSDRWNPPHRNVQISLNDIDTLEITIKPDDASLKRFNPFNYFFNNCIKSKLPKTVNRIFGSQIKKIG